MSSCALGSTFQPDIPAQAWSPGTAFRFQRDWSCSGVRQRARVTEVQGKRRPDGFLSDKAQPRCQTSLRCVLTDPRPTVSWERAHRVLPYCSHKRRGERPATASPAARAVDTWLPTARPLHPCVLGFPLNATCRPVGSGRGSSRCCAVRPVCCSSVQGNTEAVLQREGRGPCADKVWMERQTFLCGGFILFYAVAGKPWLATFWQVRDEGFCSASE